MTSIDCHIVLKHSYMNRNETRNDLSANNEGDEEESSGVVRITFLNEVDELLHVVWQRYLKASVQDIQADSNNESLSLEMNDCFEESVLRFALEKSPRLFQSCKILLCRLFFLEFAYVGRIELLVLTECE
jgi:hypothetical protein